MSADIKPQVMGRLMTRIRAEVTSLVAARPKPLETVGQAQVIFRRLELLDEAVRDLWKVNP